MKPAPFTYHRPGSLEEALGILSEVAEQDGRIIAGGQSLVPMMALRLAQPAHLVDINEIPSLQGTSVERQTLVIRALARHADFHQPALTGPLGRLLATVCTKYRALSDPATGHLLRQSCPRRSRFGMVPYCRYPGRDRGSPAS